MKAPINAAYRREFDSARSAYANGQFNEASSHLERAHILGQRYFRAHWLTHWWMLKIGLRKHQPREVAGQLLRMVATIPGYALGWIPKGNTGGTNVSALRPMPIPDDLNVLLQDFDVWKDVRTRLWIALAIVATLVMFLIGLNVRHQQLAKDLEDQWDYAALVHVSDLGTVSTLEIIPVVNWSAGSEDFKTEPGVSYLINTGQQTILFDLGFNQLEETPSPLQHNLAVLGVDQDDIDSIFISHAHRDHVGGVTWERTGSFSFGLQQDKLGKKLIYAPVPLTYPGIQPTTISQPSVLSEGIASTGPIPRQLFMGRIDEQALVINLKNKGLVVLVGCGHQTLDRLLALIDSAFEEPLYAIVGDLHYPVPQGRLEIFGIDAQRRLASGGGPFEPLNDHDVDRFEDTVDQVVPFIALGGHDTSDNVLERMENRFGDRFQRVRVGEPIQFF